METLTNDKQIIVELNDEINLNNWGLVTELNKDDPINNPWTGEGLNDSPNVNLPLNTLSNSNGLDLEIKLEITNNNGTIIERYYKGFPLDTVFDYTNSQDLLLNQTNIQPFAKLSENENWFKSNEMQINKISTESSPTISINRLWKFHAWNENFSDNIIGYNNYGLMVDCTNCTTANKIITSQGENTDWSKLRLYVKVPKYNINNTIIKKKLLDNDPINLLTNNLELIQEYNENIITADDKITYNLIDNKIKLNNNILELNNINKGQIIWTNPSNLMKNNKEYKLILEVKNLDTNYDVSFGYKNCGIINSNNNFNEIEQNKLKKWKVSENVEIINENNSYYNIDLYDNSNLVLLKFKNTYICQTIKTKKNQWYCVKFITKYIKVNNTDIYEDILNIRVLNDLYTQTFNCNIIDNWKLNDFTFKAYSDKTTIKIINNTNSINNSLIFINNFNIFRYNNDIINNPIDNNSEKTWFNFTIPRNTSEWQKICINDYKCDNTDSLDFILIDRYIENNNITKNYSNWNGSILFRNIQLYEENDYLETTSNNLNSEILDNNKYLLTFQNDLINSSVYKLDILKTPEFYTESKFESNYNIKKNTDIICPFNIDTISNEAFGDHSCMSSDGKRIFVTQKSIVNNSSSNVVRVDIGILYELSNDGTWNIMKNGILNWPNNDDTNWLNIPSEAINNRRSSKTPNFKLAQIASSSFDETGNKIIIGAESSYDSTISYANGPK